MQRGRNRNCGFPDAAFAAEQHDAARRKLVQRVEERGSHRSP
jgi:hypothetical protein